MNTEVKRVEVKEAKSGSDIARCFDAMNELRPLIVAESFTDQIIRMQSNAYRLIYVENDQGKPVAVAGFRITELLHWGKAIYIDDLSTMASERGKGYATKLLDHINKIAKENHCSQIHLDSGTQAGRYDAHRLYLNKGFNITSHHFAYMVKQDD